jgi:hypothetical protein
VHSGADGALKPLECLQESPAAASADGLEDEATISWLVWYAFIQVPLVLMATQVGFKGLLPVAMW